MEKNYDNSGTLWTNEYKTKETQPDLTGNITINGRKFKLKAWKNTKDGKGFLSLKLDTYEEKQPQQPQRPQNNDPLDILTDF
jgi:hypothetical protein